MRVAVFFMYLCFLLLSRQGNLFAYAYHKGDCYTRTRHVEKKPGFDNSSQGCPALRDTKDPAEEYLINDDVEDEDTNSCGVQKYRLLVKSRLTCSYPTILGYHRRRFKAPPFLSGQVSPKYLLQGVLRI